MEPPIRPLASEAQQLTDLVTRRRQLVVMLTSELNRALALRTSVRDCSMWLLWLLSDTIQF
jgi:hypothetical protein